MNLPLSDMPVLRK